MAKAVFDAAQLVIEGRPRRAFRLYCYRCGKSGECVMNTMMGGAAADEKEKRIASRKFSEMGWEVDPKRGKHFCPECQAKPVVNPKKEAEMTSTVVPMPRQMSRDDRRIVFEKLNEVYLDEKQGYAAPWTDEKVATDLGVPRAWVQNVREEMFGPVSSNGDIDALIVAVKSLNDEITKHREQGEKLVSAAAQMQKQVDKITKAVRP